MALLISFETILRFARQHLFGVYLPPPVGIFIYNFHLRNSANEGKITPKDY